MHKLFAVVIAAIGMVILTPVTSALVALDCPNDSAVRFGVEPCDATAKLVPICDDIGKALGDKIGHEVKGFTTTNDNTEIKVMRANKPGVGEFGPLGDVLARQVAKAADATCGNKDGKPDSYWANLGQATLDDGTGMLS
jgi:phosphonate transport system substrate-binding protein